MRVRSQARKPPELPSGPPTGLAVVGPEDPLFKAGKPYSSFTGLLWCKGAGDDGRCVIQCKCECWWGWVPECEALLIQRRLLEVGCQECVNG